MEKTISHIQGFLKLKASAGLILMAIFFFLVGFEIKREILKGELSSFDMVILPVLSAIGDMVVLAMVCVALNCGAPENPNGWALPWRSR
ncbi:Na+/H+ antiporter NhaA [Roseobacter sp. N2S]|uniref:Na+/H+ antiporter NhaA n=1 Tax=Roseobacter sp. N2S TaxID=2663844 RepID=UPI00285719F8|nr:Na+/H+ antiporter NhaA [Roseobacter sp. N2S]MDR6266778.1 Na+/H+ antiporter NhaA [Roseobacter sp. N2S]